MNFLESTVMYTEKELTEFYVELHFLIILADLTTNINIVILYHMAFVIKVYCIYSC